MKSIGIVCFLFIDNTYYRYYIDFLPIFVSLISMAFALLFSAFKVGRIIFDLAVHEFLAMIFAASDFTSGQRLKQVLKKHGRYVLYAVLLRCHY